MPAKPGTILESAQLREFAVAMPGSAPSITATYGTDPDLVLRMLAGLHRIEPQSGAVNSAKQPSGATPAPRPQPSAAATGARDRDHLGRAAGFCSAE